MKSRCHDSPMILRGKKNPWFSLFHGVSWKSHEKVFHEKPWKSEDSWVFSYFHGIFMTRQKKSEDSWGFHGNSAKSWVSFFVAFSWHFHEWHEGESHGSCILAFFRNLWTPQFHVFHVLHWSWMFTPHHVKRRAGPSDARHAGQTPPPPQCQPLSC